MYIQLKLLKYNIYLINSNSDMKSKRKFWLCILLIECQLLTSVRSSCNVLSEDIIEQHLSSKTPYRVVANWNDDPILFEGNSLATKSIPGKKMGLRSKVYVSLSPEPSHSYLM